MDDFEALRVRIETWAEEDEAMSDLILTWPQGTTNVEAEIAELIRNPTFRPYFRDLPIWTSDAKAAEIRTAVERERVITRALLDEDTVVLTTVLTAMMATHKYDDVLPRRIAAVARNSATTERIFDPALVDALIRFKDRNGPESSLAGTILDSMRTIPAYRALPQFASWGDLTPVFKRDAKIKGIALKIKYQTMVDAPLASGLTRNPLLKRFARLSQKLSETDAALLVEASAREAETVQQISALNLADVVARRGLSLGRIKSLARTPELAARLGSYARPLRAALIEAATGAGELLYAMGESELGPAVARAYRSSRFVDLALLSEETQDDFLRWASPATLERLVESHPPNKDVLVSKVYVIDTVDLRLTTVLWSAPVARRLRAQAAWLTMLAASQGDAAHLTATDVERMSENIAEFDPERRLYFLSLARALGLANTERFAFEMSQVKGRHDLGSFRSATLEDARAILNVAAGNREQLVRFTVNAATASRNEVWGRAVRERIGLVEMMRLGSEAEFFRPTVRVSPEQYAGVLEAFDVPMAHASTLDPDRRAALQYYFARKWRRGEIPLQQVVGLDGFGRDWLFLNRAALANRNPAFAREASATPVLDFPMWMIVRGFLFRRPPRVVQYRPPFT